MKTRVLIPIPHSGGRDDHVSQLIRAHECAGHQVTISSEAFWQSLSDYDCVNVQWPEALFDWKNPTGAKLNQLRKMFDDGKAKHKIVASVHNLRPHRSNRGFQQAYRAVYEGARGLIHFGSRSSELLRREYRIHSYITELQIPSLNYDNLLRFIPHDQSVRSLPENDLLTVGALRHFHEVWLLVNTLRRLRHRRVAVLWRPPGSTPVRRAYAKVAGRVLESMGVRLIHGLVSDSDLVREVLGTRVLLVPRTDTLNSATPALAMTFGRVAVGCETGNIAELLRSGDNEVSAQPTAKYLAAAIERAFQKSIPSAVNLAIAAQASPEAAGRRLAEFVQKLGEGDVRD